MKPASSPIADGYVPCGACSAYVEKCSHFKRRKSITAPEPAARLNTVEVTRQAIIDMAEGYCQTCGRQALMLYPRAVNIMWFKSRALRTDNGVAVCAMCRTSAAGLSVKEWVDTGRAPVMARMFIEDRIARRLPV